MRVTARKKATRKSLGEERSMRRGEEGNRIGGGEGEEEEEEKKKEEGGERKDEQVECWSVGMDEGVRGARGEVQQQRRVLL